MPRLEGETYFNNFQQTGYEEIREWTPRYYKDIREADANMRFAGSTVDLMACSLEKFCKNLFAKTMEEEALARMEKYFYIEKNSKLDVDERRRLLAIAMTGSGKISTTKLAELIRTYTGAEASFVFLHRLYICIHLGEDDRLGSVETLKEVLGAQMPAHIAYTTDYRTELIIDEQNLEQIKVYREIISFAVQFWHAKVLNGEWILDGSLLLDSYISHGTKPAICSILTIKGSTCVSLPSSTIKTAVVEQARLAWEGDILLCMQTDSAAEAGMEAGISISMEDKEEISGVTITQYSPGYCLLDGTIILNGHRNLDSIYKKEVAE